MKQENLQTDLSVTAQIKLYYDLSVPENAGENTPLLIAVHGYGAHKHYMMREAKLIAPQNFAVAAVQAPHQHFRQTDAGYKVGFGWLSDFKPDESVVIHQNFLLDVIENLSQRKLIDRRQIYLYGFSQACALNFRFALTYPEIMSGVLAVCGGVPSDLETNENYQPFAAQTFYLYGDDDEFYTLEKFQKYENSLRQKLPNFEAKLYHAKHAITGEMREDMKNWLKKAQTKA